MIILVIVTLSLLISGAQGCATDADCGVFETCDAGTRTCVANNAGCTTPCTGGQVCVPPNCVAAPTPAFNSCQSNVDCSLFEQCINGQCQTSNVGCNRPCTGNEVCVPPNCVVVPTAGGATTTTAATATACPSGWTRFNNFCYYVANGQFLFNQASMWCTQLGARVVWFNSTSAMAFNNEVNFVNTITASSNVRYYWIGLNRVFGQWVWTDGTPATFTNWRPSQPDGCCGANVTCVLVNYGNTLGQWDDAGCEVLWANPQGFVCKKAL